MSTDPKKNDEFKDEELEAVAGGGGDKVQDEQPDGGGGGPGGPSNPRPGGKFPGVENA